MPRRDRLTIPHAPAKQIHGEEDQIGPKLESAVRDFLEIRVDTHADEFLDGAVLAAKLLCQIEKSLSAPSS